MITVEICLGSACYVKGGKEAVDILKKSIAEHHWEEVVELKGAFCQKFCEQQNGLGITVNGERLVGVGLHNLKEAFETKVEELCHSSN